MAEMEPRDVEVRIFVRVRDMAPEEYLELTDDPIGFLQDADLFDDAEIQINDG